MRQITVGAVMATLVLVASTSPAAASPILSCTPGADPCTGIEIFNAAVPGVQASYDTGGQTLNAGLGESATTTLTSVGIAADNYFGGNNLDAASDLSAWFTMERIVITGGSGTGTILFDWSFDGSLSNGPVVGTCSTPNELGCSVNVSLRYGSLFGTVITSATLACCSATTLVVDESGSFAVTFTYGTAFTPAFYLVGGTGEGDVVLNFLNTAGVTGAVIPFGATLSTLSGDPFGVPVSNAASPVPEPASLLLALGGLAGLSARRGRRRRSGPNA